MNFGWVFVAAFRITLQKFRGDCATNFVAIAIKHFVNVGKFRNISHEF